MEEHMRKLAILLLLLLPHLTWGDTRDVRKKLKGISREITLLKFSEEAQDPAWRVSSFMLSPQVVWDTEEGALRLAHSVLLAEERGATDYKQTESLSDRIWAKKIFDLTSAEVTSAELFFYGRAAQVSLNGQSLPKPKRLTSTGWSRLKIPVQYLQKGENEFLFKGNGQLLLEPGRQPAHSFKSTDGGKTWSRHNMTTKGSQQGEYLVRLRLGQYAPKGWAMSQILDLNSHRLDHIAPAFRHTKIYFPHTHSLKKQPEGTKLSVWIRTGNTPSPDDQHWTTWISLNQDYLPEKDVQNHRWAQLKFELATDNPQQTPRIPKDLRFGAQRETITWGAQGSYQILDADQPKDTLQSSVPFVYEKPSPRLKLLRERYKLDAVIAPGQTEMEKLMLLRHWVRNQWHSAWGNHPAQWMPPWDALMILECKDQPDCLTMCTHYAAVYVQCCLALGWNARHCILDHHCVAEVYVNEHQKWVMMDAGNSRQRADVTLHFEKNGVPMSARELHLAYHTSKTKGIRVCFVPSRLAQKIASLCRPEPPTKKPCPPRPDVIPLADLKGYPVCQLSNYRRFAFPARNNFLTSLVPGELYQGWSSYFYDGYWWIGDNSDDPSISPEYSYHLDPRRVHDIDWKLNGTRIYLSQTDTPGQLQVHLASNTPNLIRFEKETSHPQGKGTLPEPCAETFLWKLQPGKNTLRVNSVNHWNRKGPPAQITVEWDPIAEEKKRAAKPLSES